jgi:paraquat-inducible protein B
MKNDTQSPQDAASPSERPTSGEFAEAIVEKRRRFSIVWLVPLIAAIIGGWVAYATISGKGPQVAVIFETAAGLEAGKTKVKLRDVQVGQVNALAISDDRRSVVATIDFAKSAEKYLTETTQFWVVRPRLDASGVSGLSTLVSGAYIEIEPGTSGKIVNRYTALESPPVVRTDAPGRRYVLLSEASGPLEPHTPIYFRGIRVGEALGYQLSDDHKTIHSFIFVRAPYDELVRDGSNFWRSGGIEVSAGTEGFKVKIGSLQSLLSGGIEFDSPSDLPAANPASENKMFTLFDSPEAIGEAAIADRIPFVLYFDGSVRGLSVAAPVEFRGIRAGTVSAIRPEIDLRENTVRIAVLINVEPQRLITQAAVTGGTDYKRYVMMTALVEKGLRAQLQTASLLTGQQLINLDFFPDDPAKTLDLNGPIPEIPTVPPAFEDITTTVSRVLHRVEDLPVDVLVGDLQKAIGTLDATLQATKNLVEATQGDVSPMVADFRSAAAAAKSMLQQAERTTASFDRSVGDSSEVRQRLALMLREISESARSIRQLADYLERNPESLVRGKNEAFR